jgi:hypothetical protein
LPIEPLQQVGAPLFITVDEHLGVASGPEDVATPFQFVP